MIIIRIALVFFLVTILGCENDHGPRVLVAIKIVSVYESHEGDAQHEVFRLSPSDQCAVGREEIEKMFGYLEVVCPGKGYGWVVMGSDYKIVNKDNAKEVR